jgi:ribosomal protein S6--L-glutamate ligase
MHILFMTRFEEKAQKNKVVLACKARGHDVSIISQADVAFVCDGRTNTLMFKNKPFPTADIIFPYWKRQDTYMWDVLTCLEESGAFVVNGPSTISPDKRMTAVTFAKHDIPHPKTWSVNTQQTLMCALEYIKPPYIFKDAYGSRGEEVFKVDTKEEAFALGQDWVDDARDFIIQEMIQPAGKDIRAFVVGNKVVAAMERTAANGDFRANISQGATAEKITLTAEEEAMSVRISHIFGCLMCGIDFMRTPQGTVFLEINKKPGLTGIESTTKVDIAPLIAEELERSVINTKTA